MKAANIIAWIKIFVVGIIPILFCIGCASTKPILPEALTPNDLSISQKYNESVTIHVKNGRESNGMYMPKLSNETLAAAVRDTIRTSKLFSEILPSGGRYVLDLYIVNVSQPYAGTEMTAGVEIAWSLKDTSTGTVVWRESIQTEKTVTSKEESMALNRLKLATEMAAKENIKEGVKKISKLKT